MSSVVIADEHRHHSVHVHGEARLDIAVDGQNLLLELEAPAMDIVGFEHPAGDAGEHQRLQDAKRMLRDTGSLFKLPENAACGLETVEVKSGLLHDAAGQPEGHADFHALYAYRCKGSTPTGMAVELLKVFPSLRKLRVRIIGPSGQKSMELGASANRVSF